MICYFVPVQNKLYVGIIVNDTNAIYFNTSPKGYNDIDQEITNITNITVERNIPQAIQSLADKISAITQGFDQDTSDIPLDFSDYTEKQIQVIKTAMKIPVNEIWPYSKVAEMAGLPKAQRFVGTTMRVLRQPYIVPVHRVKSISYIRKKTGQSKRKFNKMPL